MILSKFLNKIIVVLLSLILPSAAIASEITEFESIGGVKVFKDGKTYKGVLFSEEDRLRYLRLEIEYNSLFERYASLSEYKEVLETLYLKISDESSKFAQKQDQFLKNLEKEIKNESFFERNKETIFFSSGFLFAILCVVVYESAK